jgi:hypothetical protein
MTQQQDISYVTSAQFLKALRTFVPAGNYVLFTPHDGMIVSPDPEDIKRTIVNLASLK